MSTQRCATAWKLPIGWPNWWRVPAWSTVMARARGGDEEQVGVGCEGHEELAAREPTSTVGGERRRPPRVAPPGLGDRQRRYHLAGGDAGEPAPLRLAAQGENERRAHDDGREHGGG